MTPVPSSDEFNKRIVTSYLYTAARAYASGQAGRFGRYAPVPPDALSGDPSAGPAVMALDKRAALVARATFAACKRARVNPSDLDPSTLAIVALVWPTTEEA
jgi:hypothetical protein